MALAQDAYRLLRTEFGSATEIGKEFHAILRADSLTEAQAARIDRPWKTLRLLRLELYTIFAGIEQYRGQSPRLVGRYSEDTKDLAYEAYTMFVTGE